MSTLAQTTLPCVDWHGRRISRLLLGHNPFKGQSHFSRELSDEMTGWFDPALGNDLALLRRAEECGINTCQFGGAVMHDRLRLHQSRGGQMQWIATLYDSGSKWSPEAPSFESELESILKVDPQPIGIQNFGENSDRHFITGEMPRLREKLKIIRDTGLLVGVCTHLPEVVDQIESEGWDVDFYQTCFYTVYSLADRQTIDRSREVYDDASRERMVEFIQRASKPCLAFKVLKANRHCATPEGVRDALQYAYEQIKSNDVVCVGMWGKYLDQVSWNCRWVREILAVE